MRNHAAAARLCALALLFMGHAVAQSVSSAVSDARALAVSSPPALGSSATPYRLAPGDLLQIRFFLNPELNDEVQIRPDGRISLQLIGDIDAASKSVEELAQVLRDRYASEVKSPEVSVQLRGYGAQKVFVTGEVMKPGVISLIGGLNVLDAINEAGGVRLTGKSSSVILIRKTEDGKPIARKLSLGSARNPSEEAAVRLQPFDVIIVPPRAITRINRWVDEYLRQISPANLAVGFQYLYNRASSSVSVLPF